jgi:hypothetical protein
LHAVLLDSHGVIQLPCNQQHVAEGSTHADHAVHNPIPATMAIVIIACGTSLSPLT